MFELHFMNLRKGEGGTRWGGKSSPCSREPTFTRVFVAVSYLLCVSQTILPTATGQGAVTRPLPSLVTPTAGRITLGPGWPRWPLSIHVGHAVWTCIRKDIGQDIAARTWSRDGQLMVKKWSRHGQGMVKNMVKIWSECGGQEMVKNSRSAWHCDTYNKALNCYLWICKYVSKWKL